MRIINCSDGQEDMFLITIRDDSYNINILVDGGKSSKRCIEKIDSLCVEKIDYIVLTHIDNDHINGLLDLLAHCEKAKGAIIVYNKFVNGLISYKQAEKFEKLIINNEIIVSYKEYQESKGEVVFLTVEQRKKLQRDDGTIYFTFLSPDKNKVELLYSYYRKYKKSGKTPANNGKIVNQSSIMFILEYREETILMTGDGYIADIVQSIRGLADESKTLSPINRFDLIKLPHHGSEENNQSLEELLKNTSCTNFLLTNGNGNVKVSKSLIEILKNKTVYVSIQNDETNKVGWKNKEIIEVK